MLCTALGFITLLADDIDFRWFVPKLPTFLFGNQNQNSVNFLFISHNHPHLIPIRQKTKLSWRETQLLKLQRVKFNAPVNVCRVSEAMLVNVLYLSFCTAALRQRSRRFSLQWQKHLQWRITSESRKHQADCAAAYSIKCRITERSWLLNTTGRTRIIKLKQLHVVFFFIAFEHRVCMFWTRGDCCGWFGSR